ncbi:hypothetical protein [Methylomonas sp. CM2]|uniref:hypothetical protein n=1 Tax=Methylomonas sp. CM2 TaxID=3417647 RepID=UPI003CF0BAFF
MKYTLEVQTNYVTEPIRARFAMVIPILRGMLFSTKGDIVEQAGGMKKSHSKCFAESTTNIRVIMESALNMHYTTPSEEDNHPYTVKSVTYWINFAELATKQSQFYLGQKRVEISQLSKAPKAY